MPSKYKTIVIDDVPSCIDDVLNILKDDNRFEVVGTATNGVEGVEQIRQHNPDLVLSDIEMPVMNGFDMVIGLKEILNITPTVIFITVFDKYAIQAVKCSAFDYILKTSLEKELPDALDKFIAERPTKQTNLVAQIESLVNSFERNKQIIITSSLCDNFVNPMDILYIGTSTKSANNIFMKNGDCIATNQSLSHFETILSTTDFFRISKSNIININFIKEIKKETGILRKKYVYMKHTEANVKLQIPSSKYTKLFEFLKNNSSVNVFS